MKRRKNGSTLKQYAYAKKLLGAEKQTKKEIALSVGYSPSIAENTKSMIEQTEGFDNAMNALASETGNLVMQIYHTLKNKDLSKESVPVLLDAVTTMANAWERFTPKQTAEKGKGANKLRGIVLQRIEHQTINNNTKK